MLKVSDIMVRNTLALTDDMGLSPAVRNITESGLLGLPVVDSNNTLIGFLSEQDCLQKLMTESYHCDSHVTVADIMRRNPLSVSEELTVFALGQLMGKAKPKIYPVTQDQKLVGIVTRGHIVAALSESLEQCKAF
ncbi:MAG: CBS domain-containing protein [Amphritea sp.]|nr:CBS domain-containing protein [Amphritea sp.]